MGTSLEYPRFGFIAVAFLGCAVVGCTAAVSPSAAVFPAAALSYVVITLQSARAAVLAWLVSIVFIPTWVGIYAGGAYWQSASLVSIATLPAVFLHLRQPALNRADAIPVVLVSICLLAVVLGLTPIEAGRDLLLLGVAPYLIARVLAPEAGFEWIYRALSMVLAVLAVWAVLEYALDFHPLVGFDPGSPTAFWSEIQYRGGVARSEATFGHAIALGAVLAMAIPLTLGTRFKAWIKVSLLVLFGLAILTTASRGPLAAAFIGTLLMLVVRHDGRMMRGRAATLIVLGILAVIFSVTVQAGLGDSDAVGSAQYRSDLYSTLLPTLNPLGLAESFSIDAFGTSFFQGFESIDSAFLQIGLVFGAVPLLVAVAGLAYNLARVLMGRSSPAGIALAAQLPVFASVWLIAQYYPMVWLIVGLTVAAEQMSPDSPTPSG